MNSVLIGLGNLREISLSLYAIFALNLFTDPFFHTIWTFFGSESRILSIQSPTLSWAGFFLSAQEDLVVVVKFSSSWGQSELDTLCISLNFQVFDGEVGEDEDILLNMQ